MNTPLFYKNKPLFAIDIGQSTVKVLQLKKLRNQPKLVGYGYADFDPKAIVNGEIVKPELIAKSLKPLLNHIVIGKLTTDRIVTSIPMAHIFSRTLEIPKDQANDLTTAVTLEAQQYVPLPLEEIFLEYKVLRDTDKEKITVLMVATERKIVDSYIKLFALLKLEIGSIEPSLFAIMRGVNLVLPTKSPKVVIDFGANSSDLAIYDKTIRLTSTIATGSNHITEIIARELKVDMAKAIEIKTRYGIGKSKWQEPLALGLAPILTSITNEVQKMLRYHHERNDTEEPITDIVMVGGGASLPGLSDFLTHLTGINVTTCNPWEKIQVKPLQPPHPLEATLYATSIGLALKELEPSEELS